MKDDIQAVAVIACSKQQFATGQVHELHRRDDLVEGLAREAGEQIGSAENDRARIDCVVEGHGPLKPPLIKSKSGSETRHAS